jgi:branched-chain amino acid transport system ATP-binding protein
MTLLDVSGLTGGYTRAPVLRDVGLVVDADKIVGVLGANGAGKTTLLRALSGSLPVCRGDVRLDGEPISNHSTWSRVRAGLVHVPEGRHVFSALTVRENLDVAALAARKRVDRQEVYELFPRLAERERQLAGSLSGGEQQMLAIARGLMCAPNVIAIDELSAGLAPVFVDQLMDGLVRLRGHGIGILLVEQSPHFLVDVVDHVYLLEQGAIVADGRMEDVGGAAGLAKTYLGVGSKAQRLKGRR